MARLMMRLKAIFTKELLEDDEQGRLTRHTCRPCSWRRPQVPPVQREPQSLRQERRIQTLPSFFSSVMFSKSSHCSGWALNECQTRNVSICWFLKSICSFLIWYFWCFHPLLMLPVSLVKYSWTTKWRQASYGLGVLYGYNVDKFTLKPAISDHGRPASK